MSPFEYVMVVVSIIIGLAVTTLLDGSVRALRRDTRTRPGALHSLWVLQILVTIVGLWVIRWSGVERPDWPLLIVLAYLVMPIGYYSIAALLFPPEGAEVSLDDYFLDNRRVFFGIMIAMSLAGYFGPYVFYDGARPVGAEVATTLGFIPFYIALAWTRSRRVHLAFVIVTTLILIPIGLSLGQMRVGQ